MAVNYKSNAKAAASVVDAVKAAGGKAVAIQGDMVTEQAIERVFDEAARALGPLTHFVHSSGIVGDASRLDEATAQTIREVLDIDTFGAHAVPARLHAPHVDQARRQRRLRGDGIVHGGDHWRRQRMRLVCGGESRRRRHGRGPAREVAKEGMRVNAVSPGVIDTEIQPPGRIDRVAPMLPMGRPGKAEEVAEAILFLLSDAASYVNGANIRVSGAR